jgi:hypothetical protein
LRLRDIDDDTQAAVAWRRHYLAQRLPGDRDVLDKALQTLPAELGLADYLMVISHPETPDDLLLRPLGVVGLWGRWVRYDKTVWPSIAISPDRRLIARAGVLKAGQTFQLRRWWSEEEGPDVSNTFEARADVFDVSSGRHVWGISVSRPSTGPVAVSVSVSVQECWFNDVRWSEDGRYLSFTWNQPPFGYSWVSVVDASTWREVLRVCNGSNAFIVPDPSRAK